MLLVGLADTLMIANVREAAVSIGSMWIFRSIFFVIRFKSGKWEKGEKMIERQTGEQL